jgi:hypothetical protein
MATGPQGQQGDQGAYGSRGVLGAPGWGYGTNTGPTGSIGVINVVTVTSGTIALLPTNSGTLFRVQIPYDFSFDLPSGLASSNAGQYWSFSNDTADFLPVNANYINGFANPVKIINSGASLSIIYKGSGSSTLMENYFIF